MENCIPFIKYIYIFILFIFSWICLFNPALENIGFGSLTVVQSAYTALISLEVLRDINRNEKALVVPIAPPPFVNKLITLPKIYEIPLWWVLIPSSILCWVSTILMVITTQFLWKQNQNLNLSRDVRWKFQVYKTMFIIVTILMLFLTLVYIMGGSKSSSELYRLIILFAMVGSLGFSTYNLIYANALSKLIGSTTDG